MKKICPKCGFFILNSNCPKCGYESNHIYLEKYKTTPNDLELMLKDDYQKIIQNNNKKLIILLGPLYLSYYKFYLPSLIFTIIELYIHYIMSVNLTIHEKFSGILLVLLFILDFIALRAIYLTFYNELLMYLFKKRISKLKKQSNNQELIYKYKPKGLLKLLLVVLTIILMHIILN